jgi:toxin ParE1/3/4
VEQKILPVVFSEHTLQSLQAIFEYGAETFSPEIAENFILELIDKMEKLSTNYSQHTECRYLPTKSKRYMMFTFVSYLVIYKITGDRVEVLNVIHKSRSIATIRKTRKIRP